ncbi:MAG TPA: glycoside hydrolase family 3 C-terminal domain-containing protein [Opitutaceae bacterium]|nr:glycoside hydrolase family 3 C-terminal domain-containing protein [Opitutaceae bacterium]
MTPFQTPVSYEKADERATALLAQMTTAEKLELISGHNSFYIHGFPRLGIPELYLSDATQGVHIRPNLSQGLEKSVAFPCPISLASTWDPALAYQYAHSVGEECRAGGVAVLLGPGMNIYRNSQCGRSFEYFGEDPFLAARMIEHYVRGVLDTGTIPTLKHFVANNTDYHRRTSDSIVDERALHEIYTVAFKAGIDAGAMAVMTSYNQLNGEWCGQSHYVITDLLRHSLGFKWLVMTDWHSVWDAEKIIKSGQDLEMPGEANIAQNGARLLAEGKVSMADIDRMAKTIMRTCIAMGLYDRPVKDDRYRKDFPAHEQVALETARQGIVLLKNDGILPLRKDAPGDILVTGTYVDTLARGGGSANVEGYDIVTLRQALGDTYGQRVKFVAEPTDAELKAAGIVLLSTGTADNEGWDRPFALPAEEEKRVEHVLALNPRTVVIVNSGGGIQMTGWNDRAAALVYAWYPGQIGNRALAEILCGETNPSGKLPITIERTFDDSPAHGYLPKGETLYTGWKPDNDMTHPVYPIEYKEGVFVGYRWYDAKGIKPLYAFGSGLSYTTFAYSDARVSAPVVARDHNVTVTCRLTNSGKTEGAEVVQLYVHPVNAPVARPEKELKGFRRVKLAPGESRDVAITLTPHDFAYWDVGRHDWHVAPGEYDLWIGGASDRIALKTKVTLR